MKRLLTTLCVLLFVTGLFGANPSYEAFLGTNGIIITSNPPSGKIIVDGRALTNGFVGLTTNANQFLGVPLSIKNGALFTNIVDIGTLWVTNNAAVMFGTPGEGGVFTNNLTQFQRNNWLLSDAGKVLAVQSNTSILLQHGAVMAVGGSMQTAPTIIFIGTNAQIRTTGGSNYTFIGDMVTADPKTHIVRFLELSNYVAAVSPGGGSLTTNANQFLGVPLSIKDAALFTNTVNFGAGFLGSVTNILTAPQFLGTNVVFDGSISSWFQFNPATGPETNYVFTNIQAGQTILVKTYVTNGTTVRLWANTTEIPAAWYVGNNGSAANINSNAPSVVYVSRDLLIPATNVTVWTRDLETVAGANITFTTNFPAGTVAIASSGGGGGVGFGDLVWTNDNEIIKPTGIDPNTNAILIGPTGNLMLGPNTQNGWGPLGTDDGIVFIHDPQNGDNSQLKFNFSTVHDVNDYSIYGEWVVNVQTNTIDHALTLFDSVGSESSVKTLISSGTAEFVMKVNGNPALSFKPGTGDGQLPYKFDTETLQVTANLFELQNKGTNRFTVSGFGVTTNYSNFFTLGTTLGLGPVVYTVPLSQGAAGTVLTNNGSGVLGWGAVTGTGGGVGFADLIWTNNTDVIYPYVHSNRIHFGTASTNGARLNLEWYAPRRSFRVGQLSTGIGSDYWDVTNLGIGSVSFGSNNLAGGYMSAVLSGYGNIIPTNYIYSVIVGGTENLFAESSASGRNIIGGGSKNQMDPGVSNSVIVGGFRNRILTDAFTSSIVGGADNISRFRYGSIGGGSGNETRAPGSVVGGGFNNVSGEGAATGLTTIGGGSGNVIFEDYGTIGGGEGNNLQSSAVDGTIGGGRGNIADGPGVTIGGGALNVMDGFAQYGVISGGYTNFIGNPGESGSYFSFIPGGVSNKISGAIMSSVVGSFGTNSTPKSIMLSPAGPHGSNYMHISAHATTNVGPFYVQGASGTIIGRSPVTLSANTTQVISAGSAETNLITYSVPGNALTNSGDRLVIRASGRYAATANAKQVKLILGSETILDITSQIVNSGAWTIEAEIIRTGNTAQSTSAEYHGAGEALFTTASAVTLAQTNGIATVLKLVSTASGDGDVTNRTLTVELWPAP